MQCLKKPKTITSSPMQNKIAAWSAKTNNNQIQPKQKKLNLKPKQPVKVKKQKKIVKKRK